MAIAGVYVIFGPDRQVYVGESGNILQRQIVLFARRLGIPWTIVHYDKPSRRRSRLPMETRVTNSYRAAGYRVVSIDMQGLVARMQGNVASIYSRRAESLRAYWADPDNRRRQGERVRQMQLNATPEQRSEWARRCWVSRHRNARKDG